MKNKSSHSTDFYCKILKKLSKKDKNALKVLQKKDSGAFEQEVIAYAIEDKNTELLSKSINFTNGQSIASIIYEIALSAKIIEEDVKYILDFVIDEVESKKEDMYNLLIWAFQWGDNCSIKHILSNKQVKERVKNRLHDNWHEYRKLINHMEFMAGDDEKSEKLEMLFNFFNEIGSGSEKHVKDRLKEKYIKAFMASGTNKTDECFDFLYEKYKNDNDIKKMVLNEILAFGKDGYIVEKMNKLMDMNTDDLIEYYEHIQNNDLIKTSVGTIGNERMRKNTAFPIFKMMLENKILHDKIKNEISLISSENIKNKILHDKINKEKQPIKTKKI